MSGRRAADRGRVIVAGGSIAGLFAGAMLRRQGFAVDVTPREDGSIPAPIARESLDAVLSTLLDNARVHGATRASVELRGGAGVEIVVSDDGPGISDANAPRIFDPFFTTARDRGGTGLGLPIARALVEAHGGTLELIRGRPGATFRVALPGTAGPA